MQREFYTQHSTILHFHNHINFLFHVITKQNIIKIIITHSLLNYPDSKTYLLPMLMSTSGSTAITCNISGRKFSLSSVHHIEIVSENSFHYNAAKLWNKLNWLYSNWD